MMSGIRMAFLSNIQVDGICKQAKAVESKQTAPFEARDTGIMNAPDDHNGWKAGFELLVVRLGPSEPVSLRKIYLTFDFMCLSKILFSLSFPSLTRLIDLRSR